MPRLQRGTRIWLGTVLGLGLVVALIAVAGGWAPSVPRTLPIRQAGETMEVPGWRIQVHSAAVVNFGDGDDYALDRSMVRVRMDLTNTTDESSGYAESRMFELRLPDQTVLPDSSGRVSTAAPWSLGWDPDVTMPTVLDVDLPPEVAAPEQVTVVVHTRQPSRNFLYAEDELAVGPARWRVELDTPDERIEEES